MKNQGKIKSIPLNKLSEGITVIYEGIIRRIISVYNDGTTATLYPDNMAGIESLKTIVVENILNSTKQIPLHYSQWQSVIDNGEIDTDKIVEFNIINIGNYDVLGLKGERNRWCDYFVAKIISQKKSKKVYSEEEVIHICHKIVEAYVNCKFETEQFGMHPHGKKLEQWFKENIK